VRPEGLRQLKIPVTPSGIESATIRLVAHCLEQEFCLVLRYSLSEHKVGVEIREDRFAVLQEVNDGTTRRRNADHIKLPEIKMKLNSTYRYDRCLVRPAC
jgi:hypothetical protein